MFRPIQRCLLLALLATVLCVPAMAQASGPVHVVLTAQRVTRVDGREVLVAGDKARPGEVLEYRAVYHNDGASAVRDLEATLPIPSGVRYLPSTAAPAALLASLDGRHYSAVPLMRKERDASGREVLREVPAAEYRWLRWDIGALAAKESRTVVARVSVEPLQVAALSR